jgi:hypothetical protein
MWSDRVSEWRASGKSSTAFCKGKSFTAGGLRYWAHRLDALERETPSRPEVRLARVQRIATPARAAVRAHAACPPAPVSAASAAPPLVLEVYEARVAILPGFDRSTLAAVLDVLAAQGGAR